MATKMYAMSSILCVILLFHINVLPMSIYLDYKLVVC